MFQEMVENNTGSTILAGTAIQLNGLGTIYPQIIPITDVHDPIRGVTQTDIPAGGVGYIMVIGLLSFSNAFTPTNRLYVTDTGILTETPTHCALGEALDTENIYIHTPVDDHWARMGTVICPKTDRDPLSIFDTTLNDATLAFMGSQALILMDDAHTPPTNYTHLLDFGNTGAAAPSSTDGWKLRLYGDSDLSGTSYGFGIATDTLWANYPTGARSRWYEGAIERASLEAGGQFRVPTAGPGAGLLLGGDVHLYRSAANTLALGSGDSLISADATGQAFGGPSNRWEGYFQTLNVAGAATFSGMLTAAQLRVGTATDTATTGDLAAGLSGAARIFYDVSDEMLNLYRASDGALLAGMGRLDTSDDFAGIWLRTTPGDLATYTLLASSTVTHLNAATNLNLNIGNVVQASMTSARMAFADAVVFGWSDVALSRSAANTLQLASGDFFIPADATGQYLGGSSNRWEAKFNTLDLPASTSTTAGVIRQVGVVFHTYGTTNLFIGRGAGNFTSTGLGRNIAVGDAAMNSLTTGTRNMALGANALDDLADGIYNVAMGESALRKVVSGDRNVGVGFSAGFKTTGSNNTYIGSTAGYYQTTGEQNVMIGPRAGQGVADYVGSGNVFIGYAAADSAGAVSNKLYIENSNSAYPLIGGDFSTNVVNIHGQLGLGTAAAAPDVFLSRSAPGVLTIAGALSATGDFKVERLDGSSSGVRVRVSNTAAVTNSFAGYWAEADAGGISAYFYADGLGTGPLGVQGACLGTDSSGPLGFCTSDTERMRLGTVSGNLLINTTIDGGLEDPGDDKYRLQVNGGVSVTEVYNLSGDLKVMPDAEGNVVFFGDTNIDNAIDGKELRVWRKATEGNDFIRFYVTAGETALIDTDTDLFIDAAGYVKIVTGNHIYLDLGDKVGSNELRIRDSDKNIVASIDSNGNTLIADDATFGWSDVSLSRPAANILTANEHVLVGSMMAEAIIASGALTLPSNLPQFATLEVGGEGDTDDILDTLSAGRVGQVIVLRAAFSNTITVTDAFGGGVTDLLLDGSANKTMTLADRLTLQYDGAWYELSWSQT